MVAYFQINIRFYEICSRFFTWEDRIQTRPSKQRRWDNLYWKYSKIVFSKSDEFVGTLQTNLSVLLRIFNSNQAIDKDKLDSLCKETYESILTDFPWASVTPSLHKLLAHSPELIRDWNNGFGLKDFSEEAVEACNKLIRKYREHLARKFSFASNAGGIFVRILR